MRDVFRKLKFWLGSLATLLTCIGNRIKYGMAIKKEERQNPQPKLSEQQKKEIKRYFAKYGFKHIRPYWHRFYGGFNGQFSEKYIPQDLFFSHIEIALNDSEYGTLQDKNLLQTVFKDVPQPKTIVGKIGTLFLRSDRIVSKEEAIAACLKYKSIIVKPTIETYGGIGVVKCDVSNEGNDICRENLIKLIDSYKGDFIIQEVVDQSDTMKKLNMASLNTIRMSSYLRNNEVVILFSIVRFGIKGVFLDNISQGGFYCKINDNGSLDKYAYNTWKNTISETDEGTVLEDFTIPNYERIKEMVKSIHQKVPYFRMISWDLALDVNEQPVLIEFNAFGQSIDFQAVSGPLFREYTDEVMEITKAFNEKKLRVNIIKNWKATA